MEDSPRASTPRSFLHLPISVRTRLILANVLIVGISIAALGAYIFYRAQQATDYLSQVLESNVRQKAVDTLTATSKGQTDSLNAIFASLRQNVNSVGLNAGSLLTHQARLGKGTYWDASQSMTRLANGSWDNVSNTDPASIFIPARQELTEPLSAEINSLRQLDFVVPSFLQGNPDLVAVYFGGPSGETIYYPNVDLANIVPPDFDVTQRPWYVAASPAKNPGHGIVWSAPYLDAAKNGLVITGSVPVYDEANAFRGVVATDVQLNRLNYLVSAIRVGNTGYALVVDKDGHLIALPDAGYKDLGETSETLPLGQSIEDAKLPPALLDAMSRMRSGQSGLETVTINGQERYLAFRPIPELGYSLAIIVPTEEMLASAVAAREKVAMSATNTQQISFVLMALILGFALLTTMLVVNTLMAPLLTLTETAEEISSGNLDARAHVKGEDEIATLARILNNMTSRLRDMIQSLERRVKDRTVALEAASFNAGRRAAQFEAVTQVTRAIGSIHNMDELMPLVAAVISQYFGFYHVGIFLNDENKEFTWLIAANSEGGHRMLQRHHKLKIGEQGIVGYVAGHGETRVARKVGEDAVFFNNPDLPETQSEAALPLRRGSEVAGVLDVQSIKEDAFSDEDLGILAILADQVGLAMENTRLFEEAGRTLREVETLYRQYVQQAWNRLPQEGPVTGYRYTPRGASPLSPAASSVESILDRNDGSARPMVVPIKLRGETIGNLVVQSQTAGAWTQDQMDLVQAVADRVAFSAENARLFDETSRRAERERLVTEITSRIRSTNDPEEMIRTAVEELRNALGATDIQIIPQLVQSGVRGPMPVVSSAATEVGGATQRGNGAKK
ncbi:MAG TPA: cache domain-containing protein [Anaerolineales bacterium]|nr:cache domain-containing protein [Anaerolineales bacterium]